MAFFVCFVQHETASKLTSKTRISPPPAFLQVVAGKEALLTERPLRTLLSKVRNETA